MKRVLCPQLPKPHRPATLAESEANHAVRVLRLRDGDTVEAIDGQGHATPAILRISQPGQVVRLELPSEPGASSGRAQAGPRGSAAGAVVPLTLEMAILKGDAMEWVVEKAVELGVRRLVPLMTAHTVVQVRSKGPEAFRERWQKIADQALKQCGRLERLTIDSPIELELALRDRPQSPRSPRYWCDEASEGSTPELFAQASALSASGAAVDEVRLLIGPEGGWSEEERAWLQNSTQKVRLGPLVLRAETAALYGVSLLTSALRGQVS